MKKSLSLTIFLFSILASTFSVAQTLGMISYNEPIPSLYRGAGFSKLVRTSDGNLLGIPSGGGLNYPGSTITKLDANYDVLWSFSIDSVYLSDVIETNDGNYWTIGYNVSDIYNSAPFLVKFSPAGIVLLKKTFYYPDASSNLFQAQGICKAAGDGSDNGLIMHGGGCSATRFMIKLDGNANIKWNKQFTISSSNSPIFTLLVDGNNYVGSFTYFNGMQHVGILKTDSTGSLLWSKVMITGEEAGLVYNYFTMKENGDYFLLSRVLGTIWKIQYYTINPSGTSIVGKKQVCPGTDVFVPFSVTSCENGNSEVMLCGVEGNSQIGLYMKIDPSGNLVYAKRADSPIAMNYASARLDGTYSMGMQPTSGVPEKMLGLIDENGNGMCTTSDYVVNTSSLAFTTFDPTIIPMGFTLYSVDDNNAIKPATQNKTVLCSSNVSVDEELFNKKSINLYPNPSANFIYIETEFSIAEIIISDLFGRREIQKSYLNSNNLKLDTSCLLKGVHLIQLRSNKNQFVSHLFLKE